jgi:hypothetical protein
MFWFFFAFGFFFHNSSSFNSFIIVEIENYRGWFFVKLEHLCYDWLLLEKGKW